MILAEVFGHVGRGVYHIDPIATSKRSFTFTGIREAQFLIP